MSLNKKTRTLYRKCTVCGKRIRVKVYPDRHYTGGHYFNKLKIPMGKGEYKKVGKSNILGKKVNVVKWTGKEKEIEYWECNTCYEEAMHEYWLETMLEELYGEKCEDSEKDCTCCRAWEVYDTIIKNNRKKK